MSVFEGSRLLRGEPGSKVTLTVIRGNAADPHEIVLTREKPAGSAVSGRLMGDVGYIRFASFRAPVTEDLRKTATELTSGGAKTLVVDVRHTAEGSYENGLAAARLFVKSGTLAIKAGREKDDKNKPAGRETIEARPGDGAIDAPVLVLVTTGTAGPSELFAAALVGNKRAELIGEHTLGRAGLQKLVKLPENRGLWLTYARYLTPAGNAIQGKGLEPTVSIEEPDIEFGTAAPEVDPILDAALERAHGKKAA
jgi:carboxyl-terminal processing protease